MKKQFENLNEKQLILEYKTNNKMDIPLYFFNKYKSDILSIIKYRINKKFSSIPFEKGDFISLVWKSIQKNLKNYDFNSNVCIKNYLINCAYNYYLREVIKFCKNKELVMNNVLSYESLSEKNVFYKK